MLDQTQSPTTLLPADPNMIYGHDPVDGSRREPGFSEATPEEIDAVVQRSNAAFVAGSVPAAQRALLLRAIAEEIEAVGSELIETAKGETALPDARLLGERQRTVDQLRMFAEVVEEGAWLDARIETALPDRTPASRPDIRSMMMALGPTAVFGASNFPFAFSTAGGDTASALAAGCPVIVKAHPAHPATSQLVANAIARAVGRLRLHEGVFGHLHGRQTVGAQLVSHPLVKAVAFTGSSQGGRALWELANARPEPIPVFAEMGSVNPVFLLPGALANRSDKLATEYAAALTLGVGQFCTNPGIAVAVQGSDNERWKASFKKALAMVSAQPMLTDSIADAYEAAGEVLARAADTHHRSQASGCHVGPAFFSVPAARFLSDPGLQEEVFGPTCLLVECAGETEMLAVAGVLRGQLTATIQSDPEDLRLEAPLSAALTRVVGRLIRNGFPTGVEVGEAIQHGGPFPATTDSRFTSVGTRAILRFARPVCFQNLRPDLLPAELQDANPLGIPRRVNGGLTTDAIQ